MAVIFAMTVYLVLEVVPSEEITLSVTSVPKIHTINKWWKIDNSFNEKDLAFLSYEYEHSYFR